MIDVVVSMVSDTFADSARRGFYSTADQLILSLLESNKVRRVLVADDPRGVASQLRRRAGGDRPAGRSRRLRGVRPIVFATETPSSWSSIERRYKAYDLQLAASAKFHRLWKPHLISFSHWHSACASSEWARSVLFYAQDDEAAIPRKAHVAHLSRRAYERISEGRATTAAVSSELLSRVSAGGGIVIPNGVDPSLWMNLPPKPVRGTAVSRGLAVYAGTVDRRLDVSAFRALARSGLAVKIIGYVAEISTAEELSAIPGITLQGPVPRVDVVQQLRSADLCLLAHAETELTRAMSPLKLFEYVASGTPVVATDLPGTRDPGLPVTLVPPGGDYVTAAKHAVAAGPLREDVRRELVRAMSWRNRHRLLLDRMCETP